MDFTTLKATLGDHFQRDTDFLHSVISSLNLPVNSKVLDIGTGRGFMAINLAFFGFDVITGEPADDHWANWKEFVEKAEMQKNIHFQPFLAENLPFDSDYYDAIFSYGSFHHIEDKKKAIQEFKRVISPNGIIVIFEFTAKGIENIRKTRSNHPDMVDPRDFCDCSAFEIKIIESETINAYIFSKKNNL